MLIKRRVLRQLTIENGALDSWLIQWRNRKLNTSDVAVQRMLENRKALERKRRGINVISWAKKKKKGMGSSGWGH